MSKSVYCANAMCRAEARYVTASGTLMCAACQTAYSWGQASPEAITYTIEVYNLYQEYLERWTNLHGDKVEIWNGQEIIGRLDLAQFVYLYSELGAQGGTLYRHHLLLH